MAFSCSCLFCGRTVIVEADEEEKTGLSLITSLEVKCKYAEEAEFMYRALAVKVRLQG